MDPRTPVLVGGGQVTRRDDPVEPVDLIAQAARAAADEAGSATLLEAVDTVAVVRLLSWRYRDPGALVADRIRATPRRTGYTGSGGSTPQVLVNRAAADIAEGRADVVLIGGAEAWRTRARLRAEGRRPDWTPMDEDVAAAPLLVPEVPMTFDSHTRVGIDRPAYVYPMFEQALRVAADRSPDEHLRRVGALWSGFSEVARRNPHAWIQRHLTPEEIVVPSPANRMISSPYTKLMNSNNAVDQGAALLLCSAAAAQRYGVPRDRWIFPLASVEAHDRDDIGERQDLHRSPAIRLAGRRLLEQTGIDDVDLVDLYSCFPSAVQVAAQELGLPIDDPARPLTVTGGLTFAGGPWNNYVTHAVATMASLLRDRGTGRGLVTGNSGYLTKHALALYGVEPPREPFRWSSVQDEVDRQPRRTALSEYDGVAAVESWTVVHDRDGRPERGLLSALTPSGDRCFASTAEPDQVERLVAEDVAGAKVCIDAAGGGRLAG